MTLSDIEDDIVRECYFKAEEKEKEKIFSITKIKQETSFHSNDLNCSMNSITEELNKSKEMQIDQEIVTNTNIQVYSHFTEIIQTDKLFQPFNAINLPSDLAHSRKQTIDTYPSAEEEFKQPFPKDNKLSLVFEPTSNIHSYSKKFIPKQPAKEKLKKNIPFLKDFNPKFLKKENIDKKILRKFRNYVKSQYKNQNEIFSYYDKTFWLDFTKKNLLPPMEYTDAYNKIIEFKSFNAGYMLWLFSKVGCADLYRNFTLAHGEEVLNAFTNDYNLTNDNEINIVDKLKYYIFSIDEIYANVNTQNENEKQSETTSMINYSYVQSNRLYDEFVGKDFTPYNKTFNLTNFGEIGYARCGKKYTENNYHLEGEEYHNVYDANRSYDSIESYEW